MKKSKLWKHQQYALELYGDREYFGLLFSMGLGKTKTAIAIAEHKNEPAVIIAPNAVCQQWKDEIEKNRTVHWDVLMMTSKERKEKDFAEKLDEFIAL